MLLGTAQMRPRTFCTGPLDEDKRSGRAAAVLDGWIHMRVLRGSDRNRNRSGKGGDNIITITMITLEKSL